jgi:L-rhamnose isomerase
VKQPDAGQITRSYEDARAAYAAWGVDTERALRALAAVPISIHCWQGDDVGGFEPSGGTLEGGGIQATGNYPGRARTLEELRADFAVARKLLPGRLRFNLHAIYGDFRGKKVERDQIGPEHFASWIAWAKQAGIGLDFNGTFFSHPLAASGFTLSHRDRSTREFWIRHAIRCREIGAELGKALGTPSVVNLWIPDGAKDLVADRMGPRALLLEAMDKVFEKPVDARHAKDAVEGKLFGIGSESYVVGSHEFYLAYALRKKLLLCLDTGHYHPTETVSDKISAILLFLPELLLHVSRGIRWDSDHVVTLSDEIRAIPLEVARAKAWDKVSFALDFFDASINRVAAWVIGTRATMKAILLALLEPTEMMQRLEADGDNTALLTYLEEQKSLPFGGVWDKYCADAGVPVGGAWLDAVRTYEADVLSRRK